ncbi:MAG: NapC/NirT family cytochrome c [Chloroflexota bacterium]
MKTFMAEILRRLKAFFFPAPDSPRWMFLLPIITLGVIGVLVFSLGVYGWEYTNSPQFCGTTCHTMPPQNTVYLKSPHANVTCEECHIGRASLPDQMLRKTQGLKETWYTIFKLYEYPIRASALQPARNTCEKCHQPETFSGDSLRAITHFGSDTENTLETTYLILKTGGGAKREGLGRGIHWHIANKVEYFATDELDQEIPFVRVHNEDGTTTDYVDVESGFDASKIEAGQLQEIDCVTCHNRVTHEFKYPSDSMDEALARRLIDPSIPDIRTKGVEVLSASYTSQSQGLIAIAGLENYYQTYYPDFYDGSHAEAIDSAIAQIQAIYLDTVFPDQKIDWTTHPNNLGHINSPGCFRCHDGKHLDANNQAVRLECNLCHSIPVVSGPRDLVTKIEINSGGIEPETHLNPNWISLHNQSINETCTQCHTTEDMGGTSNTSFCSNSACHGSAFTFAGFDAPALREVLKEQIPTPPPTVPAVDAAGPLTYEAVLAPLFTTKCGACHGSSATAGLNLTTYATLMQGGQNGAVIAPNDPANSLLVKVQSQKHFVNLTAEELDLLIQWINDGAPEK